LAFALAWQDCRIKVFLFIRGSLRPLKVLDSGILTPRLLGLMALTGAGRPRSSLAPLSASQKRNSPSPPSSSVASSKPGRLPAPVSNLTQSPSWPSQRKLSARSLNSGISKASLAPMPLTPPPARGSQNTFLPPSALWTSGQILETSHLRSAG
jgi:hypothetical protein